MEWSVVFPCKYCGQKLRKSRKLAGTEVKCKHCSKKVIVPEKSQISILPKKGASTEERILFWCSYCAQKYRLPQHLAGKTGTCDNCQKHFVIPEKSQTKPDLKKTIIFPCTDCGKTLWETEDLIGVEVQCSRCGEGNIVPEKSESEKLSRVAVAPQFMPGDPIHTSISEEEKTKAKAELKAAIKAQRLLGSKDIAEEPISSAAKIAAKASIAEVVTPKSQTAPSRKTQIVITNNPPTIHKLKNYFHEKAEKFFIFAMFIVVIDYIIDIYEAGHRPLKSFVLICTFIIAGIILLGTWNFVMAEPPDQTINNRYNITCCKCGHSEIRKFKDISKQTCTKCHQHVGFTYKCDKCHKSFPYNREKKTSDDSYIIKCPFCHSEDVHYVIPKKSPSKKNKL